MANKSGANLIIAVRQQAARTTDTALITETFVLETLNEGQIKIVRETPRIVALDKTDATSFRIDRWSTSAVTIISATRASTGIVTVSATAHGLEVADIATVAGTSGTDTTFNGNFEVLSVADTNTFTYFSNLADEAATTVGTVTKLAAKPTLNISSLDPAHIGGLWILNGGSTRRAGLRYRELTDFRRKYIPLSEQSPSEPTEYTRQGSTLYYNRPVSRDYQGLRLRMDYTAWATDLVNNGTVSELPLSNKGLIKFALAECYDAIAFAQPRFESKALKERTLFHAWLDEYKSYQESLIEELYDESLYVNSDY